jgi:hypothetical protein
MRGNRGRHSRDRFLEIAPRFVANLNVLWGRADLMMTYTVSVSEKDQELTLHLP